MLGRTFLVLLLAHCSIQGGVRPQTGALGRLAPSTGLGRLAPSSAALGGAGLGVKPGGAGILGARGYGGAKAGKAGAGRYLGAGGYRPLATRGGLKQGFGVPMAGYGAGLGTGLGAGLGASLGAGLGLSNGMAVGLGPQAGKLGGRGYSNGYGLQPGYGAGGYPGRGYGTGPGASPGLATTRIGNRVGGVLPIGQGQKGNGYVPTPGAPTGQGALSNGPTNGQEGYGLGAAGYPTAGLANGYGVGLGPAAYPQAGTAGKQTGFGNVYGMNGYGDGYGAELGYPAALAEGVGLGNKAGLGAGNFGAAGLGLGLSGIPDAKAGKYGGTPGSVLGTAGGHPVVSAGLGPQGKAGGYGGAPYVGQPAGLGPDATLGAGAGGLLEPVTGGDAGHVPYNGAPVIPAGLEGDNGYSYGPQQLSLGNDGGKLSYDNGRGYRAQPAGYDAALGAEGTGPYGANKEGRQYGLGGFYGNGIKG